MYDELRCKSLEAKRKLIKASIKTFKAGNESALRKYMVEFPEIPKRDGHHPYFHESNARNYILSAASHVPLTIN